MARQDRFYEARGRDLVVTYSDMPDIRFFIGSYKSEEVAQAEADRSNAHWKGLTSN